MVLIRLTRADVLRLRLQVLHGQEINGLIGQGGSVLACCIQLLKASLDISPLLRQVLPYVSLYWIDFQGRQPVLHRRPHVPENQDPVSTCDCQRWDRRIPSLVVEGLNCAGYIRQLVLPLDGRALVHPNALFHVHHHEAVIAICCQICQTQEGRIAAHACNRVVPGVQPWALLLLRLGMTLCICSSSSIRHACQRARAKMLQAAGMLTVVCL
mmetsp:Transcript_12759/g.24038  ORF Transcript_12759/g.24038 Transcript_12759/m.24038 type:complete len:212 (-) Transcript_12759:14-649(-)